MAVADGTGLTLARVIRAGLKAEPGLNLIDSFAEPVSKGDLSVRPLGVVQGGDETSVPGSAFALLEEQVGVRVAVADGDDDPDPISMVDIAATIRLAVLRAGYSNNTTFDYDVLAQAQSGEKSTYITGVTVTAQADATLT